MSRFWNSRVVCCSAGLVAAGFVAQAKAANLLANPAFEAPPPQANPDPANPLPWQFVFDCERANFHDHTTGSGESVWMKTFEVPQTFSGEDGIFQTVQGIQAGTNYSLSGFTLFETNFSQTESIVKMGMVWEDSGGNPIGTATVLPIPSTSNPATGTWISQSISGVAPVGATQIMVSLGWSGGKSLQAASAFFDDVDLEGIGIVPTGDEWVVDGSGDWNKPANWSTGDVPNRIDGTANLLGNITADHTVFTDTAITLGTLNIANAHTYVLTGAGSLTMQVSTGTAQINVTQGTQKLNLPTVIASDTVLTVTPGANLIVANPITINSGKTLSQAGGGSVTYQSIINVQGSAGVAFANSTHAHELDIAAGGTASIGGSSTTLTVDNLSNGGKVDIKNNKLIIAYGNGADPASTVQAQLTSGYAGGAWTGNGINSSMTTSKIGVGWKDDTAGKAVTVKYTYYGDANLDGSVNTSDFTALSQHFGAASGSGIWVNGDFNYDGKVNALDFNAISTNFGAAVIPATGLGSVVPEPSTIGLISLAGYMAASRRRRARV